MTSCPLPAPARITDTPHPLVGDMQRGDLHTLDLDGCNVAYVHKRMNEWEAKQPGLSHRIESWPQSVRVEIEKAIADWYARNPDAVVKAITMGVYDGACNVALHWRPKA